MNNLYPANQSSYRTNYSTETALLRVKNDILLNMNKQHVTLLVLLDLSAAFDTVHHNVLLSQLHSKFGRSETALEWFRSYLNGRSQRVMVQGNFSQILNLDFGVPQGLASGHCFSRFMQANCLMLSRRTFTRFTATLTTRSCLCLSVHT